VPAKLRLARQIAAVEGRDVTFDFDWSRGTASVAVTCAGFANTVGEVWFEGAEATPSSACKRCRYFLEKTRMIYRCLRAVPLRVRFTHFKS